MRMCEICWDVGMGCEGCRKEMYESGSRIDVTDSELSQLNKLFCNVVVEINFMTSPKFFLVVEFCFLFHDVFAESSRTSEYTPQWFAMIVL